MEIVAVFKHHGATCVHHQCWGGRAGLDDRAAWRQVASQDSDAGFFFERRIQGLDHTGVIVHGRRVVLAHGFAAHGDDVGVQQVLDFFHDHRQASGIAEVFHEVLARRLHVQNAGHFTAQSLKVIQGEFQAQTTGNRDQVNDGVGRATDGGQCANGVFKSFAREHLADGLVGVNHLHNPATRVACQNVATTIYSWEGGIAWQADAQGLHHAGHGAGGAHGHAVAMAAVHAAFGIKEVSQLQGASTHLFAHAPDACS